LVGELADALGELHVGGLDLEAFGALGLDLFAQGDGGFAEHGFFLFGDAHGDVEVLDFFAGLGLGLFELGEFVGLTGGLGFAFGGAAGGFGGLFAGRGGVGAGGVELFAQWGGGLPGFGEGSVE